MTHQNAFKEYSDAIKKLRKTCSDSGMSDDDFRKVYFESLKSLKTNEHIPRTVNRSKTKYRVLFIFVVILISVTCNFSSIYSILTCKLQDYVYPGLRMLRKLSIPIISLFPSLTDFYHESCLVQNPFFSVVDMDCWPCSTVNNVREINGNKPIHEPTNAPFIYETDQKSIDLNTLVNLYLKHKEIFDTESSKILVDNTFYTSPQEIFLDKNFKERKLYVWRLNNMNLARLVRQIIQRPKVVPKFGQSTERFIIIDSSQEPFQIPDTECNFSFLISLSGNRLVKLHPAEECKDQCNILKVELKEKILLWYNWWYWRPKIQPSTGNTTFIGHVGSYC